MGKIHITVTLPKSPLAWQAGDFYLRLAHTTPTVWVVEDLSQ